MGPIFPNICSQKSSSYTTTPATGTTAGQQQEPDPGMTTGSGLEYSGYEPGYPGSTSAIGLEGSTPTTDSGQTMLADGSYLAGLAMGESPRKSASFIVSLCLSLMLSLFYL